MLVRIFNIAVFVITYRFDGVPGPVVLSVILIGVNIFTVDISIFIIVIIDLLCHIAVAVKFSFALKREFAVIIFAEFSSQYNVISENVRDEEQRGSNGKHGNDRNNDYQRSLALFGLNGRLRRRGLIRICVV